MSIGGSPAVSGSVPLGDDTHTVKYDGNDCDKVILDGVVIWERNYEITGNVTWDPYDHYSAEQLILDFDIGDLDSFNFSAVRRSDGKSLPTFSGKLPAALLNQPFRITTGGEADRISGNLDGIYDFTIYGYRDDVLKATKTQELTIATPRIEIVSITIISGSGSSGSSGSGGSGGSSGSGGSGIIDPY